MIKVILVGIALSFVIGFGILPTIREDEIDNRIVAQVGERQITRDEWNRAYENTVQFYRALLKDRFNEAMVEQMNLRDMALNNLINQELLLQEARRINLGVSSDELQESIRAIPYFQRDGRFNKDQYLRVVRSIRMTPSQFEAGKRDELLIGKLEEFIRGNVKISEEELWNRYGLEERTVDLSVLAVDPKAFEKEVEVDDEQLQKYFESHADNFLTPKKVSVEYATVPWKAFVDQVTVHTGDIEDYFLDHSDEYSIPEEIRLRHILLKLPVGAPAETVAEKRKALQDMKRRIDNGEDFAALAQANSEDSSADSGGDLGYLKRGELVPEVEAAAFALKPGEVSDVVVSEHGLHLLKVEDYRQAKEVPLEEVKEKIREMLKEERARSMARRVAEDVIYQARESGALEEAAAAEGNGVATQKTEPFARGEQLEGVPGNPTFQSAAFQLEEGEVSPAVKTEDGYVVLQLLESKAPEVPPLDQVRPEVEKAFRKEGGKTLAEQKAMQVVASAKSGQSFEDLGSAEGVELFKTGPFSRVQLYVPRLGPGSEVAETAFRLSEENPVAADPLEINGTYYILRLEEIQEPNRDEFQEGLEDYRSEQLEKKAEEVFRQWLSELRRQGSVKMGPVS